MGRRAIITGPTGGVGTALVKELLNEGWEVTAVIRPGSSRAENVTSIPGIRVIECGLGELSELAAELPENRKLEDQDVFFHFGWNGTTGEARLSRPRQQENVKFTLDAVRLAAALHCGVFVGAGSQSEFGHVSGKLSPDLPCDPDNEYGRAKLDAGVKSRALCRELGIRHEWVRIVSSFGPCDGDNTMVMGTLKAFLSGEERKFTAGDQIWDYIYTGDLARAFRLVSERGRDGAVYVAGTGHTETLRHCIEKMRDIAAPGRKLVFGELPYYPNQVMHLEADITALTRDTGFVPSWSFENGIRETIRWIREQERRK